MSKAKKKTLKRKQVVPTKCETYIKKMRLAADKTQEELGNELGLKPQHICNIEKFAAPMPMKHFRKLASFLKLDFNELKRHRKQDLCDSVDRYFIKMK